MALPKLWKRRPILNTLLICYIAFLILPYSLMSFWTQAMYRDSIERQIIANAQTRIQQGNVLCDQLIQTYNGIMYSVYRSENARVLKEKLFRYDRWAEIDMRNRIEGHLESIRVQSEYIEGVYLFTETGNIFYSASATFEAAYKQDYMNLPWYQDVLGGKPTNPLMFGVDRLFSKKPTRSIIAIGSVLNDIHQNRIGVLLLTINPDILKSVFDVGEGALKCDTLLFDSKGFLIASNVTSGVEYSAEALLNVIAAAQSGNREAKLADSMYIVSRQSNLDQLRLISITHQSEIERAMQPLIHRQWAFALVMIFGFVVFFGILLFTTFTPLERLRNVIRAAPIGRAPVFVTGMRDNEIGELFSDYNEMLLQTQRLIQEKYLLVLEKRQSDYETLRLQINPHFLINTLQMMSSIAVVNEDRDSVDVIQSLSGILKYILYDDRNFVPLRKELDHVLMYAQIQHMRGAAGVSLSYEIQDECMDDLIVKFMLQPIVENCYEHAFPSKREGMIHIKVRRDDERILISVEDNGCGLPERMLASVREVMNSDEGSSIKSDHHHGVRNVCLRIRHMCGKKAQMQILSDSNGTVVLFALPLISEAF